MSSIDTPSEKQRYETAREVSRLTDMILHIVANNNNPISEIVRRYDRYGNKDLFIISLASLLVLRNTQCREAYKRLTESSTGEWMDVLFCGHRRPE